MPEADFFAEPYFFTNEIMFEGNLYELTDSDTQISKIRACYLYDIDYESSENTDNIELKLFFTIGILFEYQCNEPISSKTDLKEFTCQKRLLLSNRKFSHHLSKVNSKKYFINHLSNTTFYTQSLDNGEEMLIVTATIEGIILTEYHYNFWICNELNLPPPTKLESYDWKHILKNINIEDVVMLFENLLILIKRLCSERFDNQIEQSELIPYNKPWVSTKDIISANIEKYQEQDELNNIILQLKKELSDRDYIINGLVRYLYNKAP